jgi:CHAT domain-containing protein
MTTPDSACTLRLLIAAERMSDQWSFVITCSQVDSFEIRRTAATSPDQPWPRPKASCPGSCPLREAETWDAEKLDSELGKLRRQGGRAAEVGHYLFSVLFGDDWPKVVELAEQHNATIIEVALTWSWESRELMRLPWELLHDGNHYLGTSAGSFLVTVTRVVAGTTQPTPELPACPRVLFVVGSRVTDAMVRPGTEMLALLREVKATGRRVQHRILEDATAKRLGHAIATYEPHIVHFVCHGGRYPDGTGYLRLRSDEPERDTDDYTAAQVLEQLRVAGKPPPVVMLSSCDTAGSGVNGSRLRSFGGPELAAPFAVDLVLNEVPVVLAMAGTVSDRACRVFTRTFARALAAGESLISATAEARRHAFSDVPGAASVDWALPAMFFGEKVDPDALHYAEDPDAGKFESWVSMLRLTRKPVFAAREPFFDSFWSMLPTRQGCLTGWERSRDHKGPGVLAICVDESANGVGKTRLLEEFGRAALENGHLPLLIATGKDQEPPGDFSSLAREIGRAMMDLGMRVLGLESAHGTQLRRLAKANLDDPEQSSGLHDDVREAFDLGMASALHQALLLDSDALLRAARQKYGTTFSAQSRLIVLLDNLGKQCAALLKKIVEERDAFGPFGAGSKERPVPVVMTVKYGTEGDIRRDLAERGSDQEWLDVLELRAFCKETDEDILAYEKVLLHPFRGPSSSKWTAQRWVFDRRTDPQIWEAWTSYFRRWLKGIPANFYEIEFEMAVDAAVNAKFLVPAADEQDQAEVAS